MQQPSVNPAEDKMPEEKKTKKAGFWARWGRRAQKPNNAAPLLGGGGGGGAAGVESVAARAAGGLKSPGMFGGAGRSIGSGAESAAARAAAGLAKPQAIVLGSAGRSAGILSTLGTFISSPLGILAAVVGVVAIVGATAMYFSARSGSIPHYASQFDAASVASDNSGGGGGASGSLPIAGISEDGPYQPAEAGAMPEEGTIGEPLGVSDGGTGETNTPNKTEPGKLGGAMSNEFAQNFGKSGGLGSASPSAFTMAAPGGKDSSAQSLPNKAAGSRPGGNAVSFGKLAGMKLDRGGGGGGRGARAGGGGTKKAWQQMGKVKTALEGAAAAGGEAGVAQAAATWDGGSGGGGAGAAGGSDGGSSSGASVPAGANAPSVGDVSAGGGGGPLDPALVGEALTEDMDNPMLPIATELVEAVAIASGLIVALYFAVLAFKAAKALPLLALGLLILAIAATIAAIDFIAKIAIMASKFFELGQKAEGITAIVTMPVLLTGVVGAWLGKPWLAGLGAVGALVTAFAGPLIASAFGW